MLVWVPCAFLFLWLPLELYLISKNPFNLIPWSVLNVTKLACTALLIALSCADTLIAFTKTTDHPEKVFPVHWVTPIIRIMAFLITIYLVLLHRRKGVRSSGLLFLFWALLMLAAIPQYRTEIQYIRSRIAIDAWSEYKSFRNMAYFPMIVIAFLMNCFSDSEPVKFVRTDNPELSASFLRRITFQYFDGFMWRGFRRPIEEEHIFDLHAEDKTGHVNKVFDKYWPQTEKRSEAGSIFKSLIKAFGAPLLFPAFFSLITCAIAFASPELLGSV